MAFRFSGAALLPGRAPKTPVVIAITIALIVIVGAAVFAACCPYIGFPDMMPPDDGPVTVVSHGHVTKYTVASRSATKLVVNRNGANWLTVKKVGGVYEILDSSVSGTTIIKVTAPTR